MQGRSLKVDSRKQAFQTQDQTMMEIPRMKNGLLPQSELSRQNELSTNSSLTCHIFPSSVILCISGALPWRLCFSISLLMTRLKILWVLFYGFNCSYQSFIGWCLHLLVFLLEKMMVFSFMVCVFHYVRHMAKIDFKKRFIRLSEELIKCMNLAGGNSVKHKSFTRFWRLSSGNMTRAKNPSSYLGMFLTWS